MTPAALLSPASLVATVPRERVASASIRVVVDLPLVPVTMTQGRDPPSCSISFGSRKLATMPPIIPPEPRPVFLETQVARSAARMATVVISPMCGLPLILVGVVVLPGAATAAAPA